MPAVQRMAVQDSLLSEHPVQKSGESSQLVEPKELLICSAHRDATDRTCKYHQ